MQLTALSAASCTRFCQTAGSVGHHRLVRGYIHLHQTGALLSGVRHLADHILPIDRPGAISEAQPLRNLLSMLFLGLVVAALGAVLMTDATLRLARVNEGHRLPMTWGKFAVAPSKDVTQRRVGAQAVSAVGAWIVLDSMWDYRAATPSMVTGGMTLIAAVALPVIAVTSSHNRRLSTPSR